MYFRLKVTNKYFKVYPARLIIFALSIFLAFSCVFLTYKLISKPRFPICEIIDGQISEKKAFYLELQDYNISQEAVYELTEALKPILDFGKLKVSDKFRIYLRKDGVIHKFIYTKGAFDQYFAVRDKDGKYSVFKPSIYLEKMVVSKDFKLKSSLFKAMTDGGEKPSLVMDYVNIFSWDIDFYTFPQVGDEIKIVFEKYESEGEFVRYGNILAAQYITKSKTFSAFLFEHEKGKYGHFDLAGKPVEKQFLKSPLKFTGRITSYFSRSRFHPVVKRNMAHYGVDFAAYYGAPIVAAAAGKVSFTGWKGAYGYAVIVKHNNGFETLYGHCSKILTRLGTYVNQGQTIASVGSTGWSTGPHVHYGMYLRGKPINPLTITNKPKGKPLGGKKLKEFKALKDRRLKELERL